MQGVEADQVLQCLDFVSLEKRVLRRRLKLFCWSLTHAKGCDRYEGTFFKVLKLGTR